MSAPSIPPRFVPTLTEVVGLSPMHVQALPMEQVTGGMAFPAGLKAQMVKRVLVQVDLIVERRVREAVERLILEHTQALASRLCEEIEKVVRQSVTQALEQEIAQTTPRS
jgi:hypothetical protein